MNVFVNEYLILLFLFIYKLPFASMFERYHCEYSFKKQKSLKDFFREARRIENYEKIEKSLEASPSNREKSDVGMPVSELSGESIQMFVKLMENEYRFPMH